MKRIITFSVLVVAIVAWTIAIVGMVRQHRAKSVGFDVTTATGFDAMRLSNLAPASSKLAVNDYGTLYVTRREERMITFPCGPPKVAKGQSWVGNPSCADNPLGGEKAIFEGTDKDWARFHICRRKASGEVCVPLLKVLP